MIDLVQAGPFTFCPSLFVAAYVEADQTKTTTVAATGTTGAVGTDSTQGGTTATHPNQTSAQKALALPNSTASTTTDTVPSGGVVLVLSTGSHKAKCANPESVVASIFTAVKSYFEAISPA